MRNVIAGTFKTELSKIVVFSGIVLFAISLTPTDLSASIGFGTSPEFELNTNIQPEGTHFVGYVRDGLNGLGVGSAIVELGLSESVTTDSYGRFEVYNIDQTEDWEDYTLYIRHSFGGYHSNFQMVSLEKGEVTEITVSLYSRTVILLHGIRSGAETWTETMPGSEYSFKSYLEADFGFLVLNFDFPHPNAGVNANAMLLWSKFGTLPDGIQSYSIVAHSAGALVTRAYLSRFGGSNRIVNLITLGTPHHGSPVASWLMEHEWTKNRIYSKPNDVISDLVPGSVTLDKLNYGISNVEEENTACTNHDPELLGGLQPSRVFSVAGTNHDGWYQNRGAGILENDDSCTESDGIVPTESARFWASDQFCTDVDLGCEAEHLNRSIVHFTANKCIAEKVKDILLGNPDDCFNSLPRETQEDGTQFQMLPVVESTVEPGGSFQDTVLVYALSEARFNCMWSGDILSYLLETPSGVTIDPSYADTSSIVSYYSDSLASGYYVSSPELGAWKSYVLGGADAVLDTFLLMYSVDTNLFFEAEVTRHVAPNQAILCQATYIDSDLPQVGAFVEVSVTNPDSSENNFVLLDDGIAPDEMADDGLYTAEYIQTVLSGVYTFSFHGVVDPSDPNSEERQDIAVAQVLLLPDLVIDPVDFVIGDAMENDGIIDYLDEIQITASFQNLSETMVDSARLIVDNLSYGISLIDTVVAFGIGETIEVHTDWLATTNDTTWFEARASVLDEVLDENIANNVVDQWVRVLQTEGPVSVPGEGEGPGDEGGGVPSSAKINLEPNFPNPFNPKTTIQFTVPGVEQDVEISLYDIAGRKIRTLFAGKAEAGTHSLEWNGMSEDGMRLSSGIYFCRLRVGSEVQTRKIALVK